MVCFVCKMSENDPDLYGSIHHLRDIECHYYCLLFSQLVKQSGTDNEGILGFRYEDIIKGVEQQRKYNCCFCKKPFASIQCQYKRCAKMWHLICGIKKGCLFQFDVVQSLCQLHTGLPAKAPPTFSFERTCLICAERFDQYSPLECIPAHCRPDVWMHRSCLQSFAMTAGYGLKCLLCQNPEFRTIAQKLGVFVPNKEIEWMLNQCEGGSQDPSAQPMECGAKVCKFSAGRVFPLDTTIGATCHWCSRPFHTTCVVFAGRKIDDKFRCFDCDEDNSPMYEIIEPNEKKQEVVEVPIEGGAQQMKAYLGEVVNGKVNYVNEELLPYFYGPRCARNGQFRLNYFFNSHHSHDSHDSLSLND